MVVVEIQRWDDSAKTCTLETWGFEGSIVSGETGYSDARERKVR